jgi:hypothetical protein
MKCRSLAVLAVALCAHPITHSNIMVKLRKPSIRRRKRKGDIPYILQIILYFVKSDKYSEVNG